MRSSSTRRRLDGFPARENSLNALRLGLAILVIVSHSWPLGHFGPDPRLGAFTLGEIGVAGFFTISGWLITQSRLAGGLAGFAWRRFVRIYPGYFVALLAVAFLVAPLGAAITSGTYGWREGLNYVWVNLALYINDYNVGTSLPVGAYPAWNGSLWTLFSEALCYVAIGLLVTVCPRRAVPGAVVLAWLAVTAAQIVLPGSGIVVPFYLNDGLLLFPFFFAGATLYVLRDRIPFDAAGAVLAAALLAWVVATSAPMGMGALPVAYLALWLADVLPLRAVGRRNDISYGMYIYAFPVQQLLAIAGATALGVGPYAALSIMATVPAAAASWFLVEKPAQRTRGWVSSRRVARPGGLPPAGSPAEATRAIDSDLPTAEINRIR